MLFLLHRDGVEILALAQATKQGHIFILNRERVSRCFRWRSGQCLEMYDGANWEGVFIGATTDNFLRAFDIRTGKVLWKARLPGGGQATPMSYRLADGRQYVVIAAGGHKILGTDISDALVAFAFE